MAKIEFNLQKIAKVNEAIASSFEATVDAYADQCREEIESEKWDWPRTTHRKNGEVVDSPRSIVDEGDLRDSQQDPVYLDKNTAVIEWTAAHALDVYNGHVDNGVLKPGRAWGEAAADDLDFEQVFKGKFQKLS